MPAGTRRCRSGRISWSPQQMTSIRRPGDSTSASEHRPANRSTRSGRRGPGAGYADAGPPGARPQYREDYYGAFLLDPDGNSVEAVHHGALRRDGIIDHLWLRVADVAAARRFYATIAPHAALQLKYDAADHVQFAGTSGSLSARPRGADREPSPGLPGQSGPQRPAVPPGRDRRRLSQRRSAPASAPGTTPATTPPSSSIPTATTSRSSTTTAPSPSLPPLWAGQGVPVPLSVGGAGAASAAAI